MNFELKYFETSSFLSDSKVRKIKLRKLSFSNVLDKWNSFNNTVVPSANTSYPENNIKVDSDINTNVEVPTISIDETETKKVEEEITKLPINMASLTDVISIIDTKWDSLNLIKRRALALNKTMYDNMITNTNVDNSLPEEPSVEIDEEEIKQAVKDAFEQINFNKSDVEEEVMISPEEVSNTVAENDDNNITFDNNIESDIPNDTFNSVDEPIFKFEDVNFDKISNESSNDIEFDNIPKENKFIMDDNSFSITDDSSSELESLLEIAKQLKNEAEEQERKTNDAHKLAMEKEAEKEKVKADFAAYQPAMKEELERRKKEEQEALEQARKDEEFTSALVNLMNNSAA